MAREKYRDLEITEQEMMEFMKLEKKKKKKLSIFTKLLLFLLSAGLIGQTAYFVYMNQNLLFKTKTPQVVVEVTPKEKITLTEYEKKTETGVKAIPTFVGDKAEATAVAHDFASKYLTMSNLKANVDFLGSEYIYQDEIVQKNFREYALTNYYYYFTDIQKSLGQEGLPEIESTKVLSVEEVGYVHANVTKDSGYVYSVTNAMQSNSNFMKKKFKGYTIDLNLTFVSTTQTKSWSKNAPDTMRMVVLFDADTGKWFIGEFRTFSSKTNVNNNVPITNPSRIGN